MKLGIISNGPADQLVEKAKELNPKASVVVVDETTYRDPELAAVFVFEPYRSRAEEFNDQRREAGVDPFSIVDVPLSRSGRRAKHSVRQRIVEILKEGPAYGYEIYKKYRARHGDVSLRLIYYHLNRGLDEGLFKVADVKEKEGDFSWGPSTRRKYYELKFSE